MTRFLGMLLGLRVRVLLLCPRGLLERRGGMPATLSLYSLTFPRLCGKRG